MTTRTGLAPEFRYGGGVAATSAGTATITSSMMLLRTNASTLRWRIGRPASVSSCFGRPPPKRAPCPPAAISADTYTSADSTALPLYVLADALDGLAYAAPGAAAGVFRLPLDLVGGAAPAQARASGQITGGLLRAPLGLVHLPSELVPVHLAPPAP